MATFLLRSAPLSFPFSRVCLSFQTYARRASRLPGGYAVKLGIYVLRKVVGLE